jgi:cytochrome c peroxidase
MKTNIRMTFGTAALAAAAAVFVSMAVAPLSASAQVPAPGKDELIKPLPVPKAKDPAQVALGQKLFFDPRLSKSGFISCNSCHNLSMGGSDNLKTSIGDHWQKGPINSPTVLNSSLSLAQFWDGRAKDLKAQAGGPIANPGEMAFTHELAVEMLNSIPGYQAEFKKVFKKSSIDIDQVTTALASFEETLVTPNARFDKWLKGDTKAITKTEYEGYQLFKNSGCVACHNGINVGGNSFQKFGVVEPYKTDNPAEGRVAVTGNDADRFNFKVPTLRNVELTYPYFHDGAADTLEQAVNTMGRVQLGKHFTPEENTKVVAFLKTLTGEQPRFQLPQLPPSSDATPRPTPFN